MKKSQLNQNLIESLSESVNDKFVEGITNFVYNVVSSAVSDISERTPFVSVDKCVIIPVNEAASGAFSQLSEFDFFFGVDNPQIAFNTKTKSAWFKNFWKEYKANFRIGRKKRRKRKKKDEEPVRENPRIDKYKLSDLKRDLMMAMADYLSESSVIYDYPNHLAIVGKEDFGTNVKINIYVSVYIPQTGVFRMYNANRNTFSDVDFGERYSNLEQKKRACGEKMVVDMLKLFNAMYVKATNKVPNQVLIESLVCACPNKLFIDGDVYRTFLNVANYIRLVDPQSILSIANPEKTVFTEPLVINSGSQIQYNRLISILDTFKF